MSPLPPDKLSKKWLEQLTTIAIFALLILGFGCSLCQKQKERSNPQNLATLPIPKVVAPSITKPPTLTRIPKGIPTHRAPKISANAAIVIDAKTGETFFEKNADSPLPVASTQKILTALVTLEEGPLDELIPISLAAAMQIPSKAGLLWRHSYSRKDLLEATLIQSANDAAVALAEAKNYNQFIQKMNKKAASLGATSSRFTNPHGLDDPNQFSTARDLSRIAFHAYRNPIIREICIKPKMSFKRSPTDIAYLQNTNRLILKTPFNGMKGGFTLDSGKTLIATAQKKDKEAILILLKTNPSAIHAETIKLWKWFIKTIQH